MYLESGNIVHAKAPNSSGEYGFFTIMGWKTGKISFEADEPTPERTISIFTEEKKKIISGFRPQDREFQKEGRYGSKKEKRVGSAAKIINRDINSYLGGFFNYLGDRLLQC